MTLSDIFTETNDNLESIESFHTHLVGEGKKFKTDEDLARGKYESDRYIKNLEQKLDELKQELNTKTSMDDFLTEIRRSKEQNTPDPSPAPTQGGQVDTGLDDSTLEAKLEALLAQRENKIKQETNLERVTRILNDNFGAQAQQVINNKARELGMSVSDMKDLSIRSPAAFFNLIGAKEVIQPNPVIVPRSNVNNSQMSDGGVRNHKYYENLKKTNPKLYFDGKTTVQQIADRKALGDRYYE